MKPPYDIYRAPDNNNDDNPPPTPPHRTRAQRLRARAWQLRHRAWMRMPHWSRDPGNWITGGIVTVGLGAALAVIAGIAWLVMTIVKGIGSGIEATGNGIGNIASGFAGWVTGGPITHTINDPVRAYLDTHTTGLPATGRALWILWLVTVCALYLAALSGSRYGRVGWALIGALTAVAVWHGTTPAASRPTAAATTAAVWLVLSLLAYARTSHPPLTTRYLTWMAEREQARRTATHPDLVTEPA